MDIAPHYRLSKELDSTRDKTSLFDPQKFTWLPWAPPRVTREHWQMWHQFLKLQHNPTNMIKILPHLPLILFLVLWLVFVWGPHPTILGLFLALCSVITSGGAPETIWDTENRTWVGCVQGKCLAHWYIALTPVLKFFFIFLGSQGYIAFFLKSNYSLKYLTQRTFYLYLASHETWGVKCICDIHLKMENH